MKMIIALAAGALTPSLSPTACTSETSGVETGIRESRPSVYGYDLPAEKFLAVDAIGRLVG